jgi:hypothetical protein
LMTRAPTGCRRCLSRGSGQTATSRELGQACLSVHVGASVCMCGGFCVGVGVCMFGCLGVWVFGCARVLARVCVCVRVRARTPVNRRPWDSCPELFDKVFPGPLQAPLCAAKPCLLTSSLPSLAQTRPTPPMQMRLPRVVIWRRRQVRVHPAARRPQGARHCVPQLAHERPLLPYRRRGWAAIRLA